MEASSQIQNLLCLSLLHLCGSFFSLSDVGAILHSPWSGVAYRDMAAGAAILTGSVHNYYAVFLLFSWEYTGAYMGSIPL